MWYTYLFYIYHELKHAYLLRVYRLGSDKIENRTLHETISWASSLVLVGIVINHQNDFAFKPRSLIGIPFQVMELVNKITKAKDSKAAKEELHKFVVSATNPNYGK